MPRPWASGATNTPPTWLPRSEMKPATRLKLLEDADLLRRPELLDDFAHACEADYRGRGGHESRDYPQGRILRAALEAALAVRARDLDTEGLKGSQVGNLLRKKRIEAIARTLHPSEQASKA